jgi:hypothetical protein
VALLATSIVAYTNALNAQLKNQPGAVTQPPFSKRDLSRMSVYTIALRHLSAAVPSKVLGICDLLDVHALHALLVFPQLVHVERQSDTLDLG